MNSALWSAVDHAVSAAEMCVVWTRGLTADPGQHVPADADLWSNSAECGLTLSKNFRIRSSHTSARCSLHHPPPCVHLSLAVTG